VEASSRQRNLETFAGGSHQAPPGRRDAFIFTDRRIVLVDKQGVTGKKVEYHTIPYRSIIHFSVETAGSLDLDAELKIWLSGMVGPIEKQFNKGVDIYEVQALMAHHVARA